MLEHVVFSQTRACTNSKHEPHHGFLQTVQALVASLLHFTDAHLTKCKKINYKIRTCRLQL